MKRFLTIMGLLLALAVTTEAQRFDNWTDGPDTSTTTVKYLTGGGEYGRPVNLTVNVFVDVTGTESATVKVEVQPVGGSGYYPLKAWTAISADTYLTWNGSTLGGTIRVSVLSTDSGSAAGTAWVNVAKDPSGRFLDYWKDGPDTTASTAINLAGGGTIDDPIYWEAGMLVDVVGDTATMYVDYLPYGGATWIPYDTVATILVDTYYLYQSNKVGGKIRGRVKSDGAGSSALTMWVMYAKKEDD
jgi:hypothetical protein